jgi:putative acetyltransferase
MRLDDARQFLEVHHAAVRGIAAKDYLPNIIEVWAPLPVTEKHIEMVRLTHDSEYRVIAEIDGKVVGIGSLVVTNGELRACYVSPEASRKGVGSALIRELERVAGEHGIALLEVDSSVTAEPFYAAHGYKVKEHSEHILHSGQRMACVKMHKELLLQNLDF